MLNIFKKLRNSIFCAYVIIIFCNVNNFEHYYNIEIYLYVTDHIHTVPQHNFAATHPIGELNYFFILFLG